MTNTLMIENQIALIKFEEGLLSIEESGDCRKGNRPERGQGDSGSAQVQPNGDLRRPFMCGTI